jgi:Na+-translocating ferredoxin:NAD+ oxidoreductase RnfG subunit
VKRIVLVLSLFTCCSGILLGDRTQPQTTTAPTFSDKQFSILLDMLADEKRSRLKLEERVITLENELHSTYCLSFAILILSDLFQYWHR